MEIHGTVIFVLLVTLWTVWVVDGLMIGKGELRMALPDDTSDSLVALIMALYAVVYHTLLFMMLWSYYKAIRTPPQPIPAKFKISEAELNHIEDGRLPKSVASRDLPVLTRSGRDHAIGVCKRCMIIKPDRAHHCSTCKQCVMKMDHHCPWVANCVGHHNYKFFCLFLNYLSLFLLADVAMCVPFIIKWSRHGLGTASMQTAVMGVVAIVFLLTVGPLCLSHCGLTAENETTLESMRKSHFARDTFQWNLRSCGANCSVVYGPSCCRGMCPVASNVGDGVEYGVVFKDTLDRGDNLSALSIGQVVTDDHDHGGDGDGGDGDGDSDGGGGDDADGVVARMDDGEDDGGAVAGFRDDEDDDAESTSTLTDNLLSGK